MPLLSDGTRRASAIRRALELIVPLSDVFRRVRVAEQHRNPGPDGEPMGGRAREPRSGRRLCANRRTDRAVGTGRAQSRRARASERAISTKLPRARRGPPVGAEAQQTASSSWRRRITSPIWRATRRLRDGEGHVRTGERARCANRSIGDSTGCDRPGWPSAIWPSGVWKRHTDPRGATGETHDRSRMVPGPRAGRSPGDPARDHGRKGGRARLVQACRRLLPILATCTGRHCSRPSSDRLFGPLRRALSTRRSAGTPSVRKWWKTLGYGISSVY